MPLLTAARSRSLLRAMRGRRVLVLGDVMLDEFLWGHVARISPEAPVPVIEIQRESFHVGGAGNVARNVRSLDGAATLVGVVGRDAAAARLRNELRAAGVEDALVEAGGRPTTLKTRIVAHHQQVCRADRERSDDLDEALEDAVIARIAGALRAANAMVVSDYQKGVVTARVMRAAVALARKRRVPVLVDPKVRHFALYRGATIVTPNLLEAEQASGVRIRDEDDVGAAGARLLRSLRCRAVLITRGEQGMTLFEAGRRPVHIPTAAREVFDVTGAGDTVIATLSLALCAGASLPQAAALANDAAGIVVGKLGTAITSPDELVAAREASRRVARGADGRRRRRRHALRPFAPSRETVRRRAHGQGARAPPRSAFGRSAPRAERGRMPLRFGLRRIGPGRPGSAGRDRSPRGARRLAAAPGRGRRSVSRGRTGRFVGSFRASAYDDGSRGRL
jgi:D-glycero-beta-D-manno-heptose-7-phosphate kinase